MPICSYSGKQIPPGTGIMFVKNDGKVLWFADSKCEKGYIKLKRKPRNVAWTAEARKAKEAAMNAKVAKPVAKPVKESKQKPAKAPAKEAKK